MPILAYALDMSSNADVLTNQRRMVHPYVFTLYLKIQNRASFFWYYFYRSPKTNDTVLKFPALRLKGYLMLTGGTIYQLSSSYIKFYLNLQFAYQIMIYFSLSIYPLLFSSRKPSDNFDKQRDLAAKRMDRCCYRKGRIQSFFEDRHDPQLRRRFTFRKGNISGVIYLLM